MQSIINQFGIYYPIITIQDKMGNMISTDSQVVVLSIDQKGNCLVCRYGNYKDSVRTNVQYLSKIKAKK